MSGLTMVGSSAQETTKRIDFSDTQTRLILQILIYGVIPSVSVLGIFGNMSSIWVLARRGMQKCANIMLISLALSDMNFLIGLNSIPRLIYDVIGDMDRFAYSYALSYALYVFYNLFHIVNYASLGVSLTLPMFITLERLVAVFAPFHIQHVITPFRTWLAIGLVNVFWYAFFIHMSFYLTFTYEYNTVLNVTVGFIGRSSYHYANLRTVLALEEIMSYLMMKIPPVFTLVGCVCIGVKVKMASVSRLRLTSGYAADEFPGRTTKILLAVCVVYTVTCGILSLPVHIPQYMYYTMTSDAPSNFSKIMYHVMNLVVCFNCSCNFVLYVGLNKNFRETYKKLLWRCWQRKQNKSCAI